MHTVRNRKKEKERRKEGKKKRGGKRWKICSRTLVLYNYCCFISKNSTSIATLLITADYLPVRIKSSSLRKIMQLPTYIHHDLHLIHLSCQICNSTTTLPTIVPLFLAAFFMSRVNRAYSSELRLRSSSLVFARLHFPRPEQILFFP